MKNVIKDHLQVLFDLTTDLANAMDEVQYDEKLSTLPSNTLGGQLWCLVGTRESQLAVLKLEQEFSFSCSVSDAKNKLQIMQALFHSSADILVWLDRQEELQDSQLKGLLEIIEHEAQHHGQLIRYVYGNKWVFPESWKKYYTV